MVPKVSMPSGARICRPRGERSVWRQLLERGREGCETSVRPSGDRGVDRRPPILWKIGEGFGASDGDGLPNGGFGVISHRTRGYRSGRVFLSPNKTLLEEYAQRSYSCYGELQLHVILEMSALLEFLDCRRSLVHSNLLRL